MTLQNTGQSDGSPAVDPKTGQQAGSQSAEGQNADSLPDDKGKPLPYDQDPKWKSARAAEAKLQTIMETFGFDSVDSLEQTLDGHSKLANKLRGMDVEKLIERSQLLDNYESYWATQEEGKRRQEETPEQTIARLEQEKNELRSTKRTDEASRKEAEAAQRAVQDYESSVNELVSKSSIPESYREMAATFLGVQNPAIEVDITDKIAVRKMARDGVEKFGAFVQQVIKDYVEGKLKIPNIPPVDSSTSAVTGDVRVKNLKDARRMATENLKNLFSRR